MTIEEQLKDALIQIKDLQIRVLKLEKSVKVKAKKWEPEEERFLIHLAQTTNLTRDQMRTRTTKFLFLVMAFQKTHDRTERSISMRLTQKYFEGN